MIRGREHLATLPTCPYLPMPDRVMHSDSTRAFGKRRDAEFYQTALLYAHSLWLQGFPAQSLLLLNRAMGSELDGSEPILAEYPMPYRSVAWVLAQSKTRENQFIGNPRRHYQHLATRMVEPRKDLRTWRAWACWQISRVVLPECIADEKQIREEGVIEPTSEEIAEHLEKLGLPDEVDTWKIALCDHS